MKKYFFRVKLCMRKDFSKGVFCTRWMDDLRDLADSLAAVIAETLSALISIIRLLLRPFVTALGCLWIPIKHGSKVEEKLSPNDKMTGDKGN